MNEITPNLSQHPIVLEPVPQSEREYLLDQYWKGDVLERRKLAADFENFIRNRHAARHTYGLTDAYTIAVEADYGLGKSFFLQRLHKQLSLNHPVAFIDAWADDTSDDPFGSLVYAVTEALKKLLPDESSSISTLNRVKNSAGEILRNGKWNLSKALVSVALETGAKWAKLDGAGDKLVDAFSDSIDGAEIFEDQTSKYQNYRAAVDAFRQSVHDLIQDVLAQNEGQYHAPLIIIVDELDRCRPSYAVQLLEEVKHLFAVPDIVFIYGMNQKPVVDALSVLYGTNFDGEAYLRRFVARRFVLPAPSMLAICRELVHTHALPVNRMKIFGKDPRQESDRNLVIALISQIFDACHLTIRDAQHAFDYLSTFCAAYDLTTHIETSYLCLIACKKVRNVNGKSVLDIKDIFDINREIICLTINKNRVTLSTIIKLIESNIKLDIYRELNIRDEYNDPDFNKIYMRELFDLERSTAPTKSNNYLSLTEYERIFEDVAVKFALEAPK